MRQRFLRYFEMKDCAPRALQNSHNYDEGLHVLPDLSATIPSVHERLEIEFMELRKVSNRPSKIKEKI